MRVALIGQPNCGKSTLFNQVAGYKAETGNFSGTTVTYTESRVRVAGEVIELVDLPGAYTLEGGSPAEMEAANYLRSQDVDIIINVAEHGRVVYIPNQFVLYRQHSNNAVGAREAVRPSFWAFLKKPRPPSLRQRVMNHYKMVKAHDPTATFWSVILKKVASKIVKALR